MRGEQAVSVVLLVSAAGYVLSAFAVGAAADLTYPFRDASVWPILLFAGIVGGGFPALLFITGVRWIGGTRTAILALFEPVTGVILAALLLGEALYPIQALGGALVLLAAAVLQRTPPAGSGPIDEPPVPALV